MGPRRSVSEEMLGKWNSIVPQPADVHVFTCAILVGTTLSPHNSDASSLVCHQWVVMRSAHQAAVRSRNSGLKASCIRFDFARQLPRTRRVACFRLLRSHFNQTRGASDGGWCQLDNSGPPRCGGVTPSCNSRHLVRDSGCIGLLQLLVRLTRSGLS